MKTRQNKKNRNHYTRRSTERLLWYAFFSWPVESPPSVQILPLNFYCNNNRIQPPCCRAQPETSTGQCVLVRNPGVASFTKVEVWSFLKKKSTYTYSYPGPVFRVSNLGARYCSERQELLVGTSSCVSYGTVFAL